MLIFSLWCNLGVCETLVLVSFRFVFNHTWNFLHHDLLSLLFLQVTFLSLRELATRVPYRIMELHYVEYNTKRRELEAIVRTRTEMTYRVRLPNSYVKLLDEADFMTFKSNIANHLHPYLLYHGMSNNIIKVDIVGKSKLTVMIVDFFTIYCFSFCSFCFRSYLWFIVVRRVECSWNNAASKCFLKPIFYYYVFNFYSLRPILWLNVNASIISCIMFVLCV